MERLRVEGRELEIGRRVEGIMEVRNDEHR
jgi:hypothetical protein